jgi:hypothetical protein
MTNSTTLTERQQYWLKHIRACDAAGQTTINYARAHGINVKSMYSARKALAEKGTLPCPEPGRFQRVQLADHSLDSQWQVRLPNGAVVAFSAAVNAATLTLILNAAATLS